MGLGCIQLFAPQTPGSLGQASGKLIRIVRLKCAHNQLERCLSTVFELSYMSALAALPAPRPTYRAI
jgi:hypothetical protein